MPQHHSSQPSVNEADAPSCCAPKPAPKVDSCCGSSNADAGSAWRRLDWLFWGSSVILLASLLLYLTAPEAPLPAWMHRFAAAEAELIHMMWLGMLLGVFFVGLMNLLPANLITRAFGERHGLGSIMRAASAGIVLDLCNHGLLVIAAKLYRSGVRYSQVLAFLIASPWNSLSLTVVMFALLGWQWTLAFIGLSFVVAVATGLLVDRLERAGRLAPNPHTPAADDDATPVTVKENIAAIRAGRGLFKTVLIDAFTESKVIMRWLLFGMVIAAAIKTFVPAEAMQTWFGPTLIGLGLTLLAATVIEVCSEGLLPVAADLMSRAAAPGNAFAFLMAGVSTDYTEMLVLRQTTGRWRMALLLPLLTLPQIILIGILLNAL